jgi:hypothetical protein
MLFVDVLGRGKECDVDTDQYRRSALAGGTDPEIPAARMTGRDRPPSGEEVVVDVDPPRREDVDRTEEEPVDLVLGAADRGRRGDHLRTYGNAVELPGAQFVDRGLVQTDHRPERPADQVQLVLDHQVRRP